MVEDLQWHWMTWLLTWPVSTTDPCSVFMLVKTSPLCTLAAYHARSSLVHAVLLMAWLWWQESGWRGGWMAWGFGFRVTTRDSQNQGWHMEETGKRQNITQSSKIRDETR